MGIPRVHHAAAIRRVRVIVERSCRQQESRLLHHRPKSSCRNKQLLYFQGAIVVYKNAIVIWKTHVTTDSEAFDVYRCQFVGITEVALAERMRMRMKANK